MKYTNFCKPLEVVKAIQDEEIRVAVTAHGGLYAFPDSVSPSVEFYGGNGPCSAAVQAVRLENGKVLIEVCDDEDEVFDIEPADLYPGAAQGILENIPEPVRVGNRVIWDGPAPEEAERRRAWRVTEVRMGGRVMITDGAGRDREVHVSELDLADTTDGAVIPGPAAFDNTPAGLSRYLAGIPARSDFATDPVVRVVVENGEGEIFPVAGAWYDKEGGMVRLSI